MKWQHKENGDWEAIGQDGDFLLWKDCDLWRGRYRSKDHKKHFFVGPMKKLFDLKELCENNYYWENGDKK